MDDVPVMDSMADYAVNRFADVACVIEKAHSQ
jgi:hypothetical protein